MSVLEAIMVAAAGVAAGVINSVVGSGTLVTFPALLAAGYSPLVANVSNTLGLVPGSVAGAIGYRRELKGQLTRALRLGAASAVGAIAGCVALLTLPSGAFRGIVPVFIVAALVLIVLQPRLSRHLARREARLDGHGLAIWCAVLATGVYGGYFGAAQGILLLAILATGLGETLQRINGLKNVLTALVNLVAGVIFAFAADVAWGPVALIAGGSLVGGLIGGRYGRRLPPDALRAVILLVGLTALFRLLLD